MISFNEFKIDNKDFFNWNYLFTGEVTNKAINENIDELFKDFKPVVDHTLSRIIEDLLTKSIIGNVPYDELYPVNPKFN